MKKLSSFILIAFALLSCKPYNAVQQKIVEANQNNIQVVTRRGEVYEGRALLPKLSSKLIVLRTTDGSEIQLPSNEIDHLVAWHKDKTQDSATAYRFIYSLVKEYESLDLNNKNKIVKAEPRWLLQKCIVNDMTMYVEYQGYDITKEGRIDGQTTGVVSLPPKIWYYIQKEGDSIPVRVALDASAGATAKQYFKNIGQKYFEGCPTLVKKIEKGELKTENLEDAMKQYEPCK